MSVIDLDAESDAGAETAAAEAHGNGTEEAVEDEDEEVREAIRLSLLDTPPGSREGSQREAEVETRGPSGEDPARQLVDAVETIALPHPRAQVSPDTAPSS